MENGGWWVPMCIGALDGKLINFKPSRKAGSFYYNYKENLSIMLLTLIEANYWFVYVVAGLNGCISVGRVFKDSSLCRAINTNKFNFPPNQILPDRSIPVSYTIVGDALRLSRRFLKLFPLLGSLVIGLEYY